MSKPKFDDARVKARRRTRGGGSETKGSRTSHELASDGTDDSADAEWDGDESSGGDFDDTAAAPEDASPSDTGAAAATKSFEGRKVKAGASINPPDPVAMCDEAKADATTNAANGGYSGGVTWDRLSNDSDCSLSTTIVGRIGVYYIFTARGTFNQN